MTTETFVDCQPELQRLRDTFDAARDGHGGVALVTGEAGIGKNRLARLVRCAPYWPWVQAVRSLIEATDGEELFAWLGDGAEMGVTNGL